ncbi:hypothetical protein E2542_SST20523 [Spatholobus suberectus]|nr:hypothetical protein E2542_SST20523 [Spatholobus suberectus]
MVVALVKEEEKVVKTKMNSNTHLKDMRNRKVNATVIPPPRKSVKRMMFETMVRFLTRFCFASEGDPSKYQVSVCSHMDPINRATRRKKNKRTYATTDPSLFGGEHVFN